MNSCSDGDQFDPFDASDDFEIGFHPAIESDG